MTIHASVVVPTRDRPALLDACLHALLAQDMDPATYEIIVVDDAAREETERQVQSFSGRGVAVRYVRTAGARGPAAARNLGWHAARGDIVAFTDDDCVPDPSWLRAGIAGFVDGVAGVSGQTIVPLKNIPTDYEYNAAQLAHSEFVTANCFYRRRELVAAGGFDERFSLAWREDTDMYFTLLARNARLVHEPAARVTHAIRPSPWGVSLRQQRKSMFNALLYKKHPQLYRARIQSSPPWQYYWIDLSLVLTIFCMATGRRRISVSSGILWLILTAQFCARRLRHTSRAPQHVAEMLVTSILIPPAATYWRLRGAIHFRVPFL